MLRGESLAAPTPTAPPQDSLELPCVIVRAEDEEASHHGLHTGTNQLLRGSLARRPRDKFARVASRS